ncbi:two-component system, OmpR family, response regulator ArlR [Cyclonatronum proteinivorum]|uniref:Two-component system, OmpR family, response regulator ArlR n=1 Tax=Cyclonatronum proteinivorum TaxID=1457365 RepID=A0A345UK63_9BACT|nr:response regulator transcription factor [Cyclonatronum proteinivorum]AXJ00865.1 two-component system, OmpR family, response regulator ArlR [Cyclonatronum proteinivorum]
MKVLVVEDDVDIIKLIKIVLEKNKFEVEIAETGTQGLQYALSKDFDCIVLDIGLPEIDGLEVCRAIRNHKITTPILILSAFGETDTKVSGLNYGADDYIEKPFEIKELLARIHALIRRSKQQSPDQSYSCGSLKIDLVARSFKVKHKDVSLTNNEFEIMAFLFKNSNRIVSIDELSDYVWPNGDRKETNHVNVYISYIRKKISAIDTTPYIITVRYKGFKLIEPDS